MIIAALVGFIGVPLAFIILLYREQKDKEYRRQNNLPPKKYHDITDYDVYTFYTIVHK